MNEAIYQSLGTRMLKIISQFYVHTSLGTLVLLADWSQQQEIKHKVFDCDNRSHMEISF